ncbi:MAG: penicillin-binding protein 2 [Candidatus Aminicenantes bacterium]|nr:penicillin-binding protein 2 [Candidatus Aminicenantes bacterium]
MEKEGIYEDLSLILKRIRWGAIVVGILLGILLFYYWKIQILDHRKYSALAEANRTRESLIPAPRGLILDRNAVILADNAASFKASLIRENGRDTDRSLVEIGRLLDIPPEDLRDRISRYGSLPAFRPVVIMDNLELKDVSRIEARRLELPELIVETDPRRHYPFGSLAAHVIGYLQELTEAELKSGLYPERTLGDMIGRTGVERQYQSVLVGTDGRRVEIVDSQGRSRGDVSRVEPVPGRDIRLTLDLDLQQKATTLLEGREGAIVVLDPRNGEVLALASFPTYDPNKFITRFSPQEWMDLIGRPDHPLENRSIRGLYSPGSVFKLTMALGALDSGLITEQTAFFCSGSAFIYGRPFRCWYGGGHGTLALIDAIRYSCNVYFYNVGRRMAIDQIAQYAEMLGFGDKTGVDLPGEKEGLVPSTEWSRRFRNSNWYPGETISVSIGQGPILVTPLQVALHTAIIANRGRRVVPHLLLSPAEEPESARPPAGKIRTELFNKVIQGMWKCVNEEGTARGAKVGDFEVCGKTGSTQVLGRERAELLGKDIETHSWFSGFAPRGDPRVVVTVLVEFGGMGGATAAPLAKELFALYREKYD